MIQAPFSVYGLLVALGFLAAYGATFFFARRADPLSAPHIDRLVLWVLIPGVIGARALFVLYHFDYFSLHPQEIIAVWHGGWVWHGALFGGLLGVYAYCRRASIAFLSLLDILAPGVALGQAIGRWGNYFNQEAYGLPTNLPWGTPIDPSRRLAGYEAYATFHPTFLYESLFNVGLFLCLGFMVLRWRKKPVGAVFFLSVALYSLGRFFIEFLRIDSVPIPLGLRFPQWISLALIAIGCLGLIGVLRKQKKLVY